MSHPAPVRRRAAATAGAASLALLLAGCGGGQSSASGSATDASASATDAASAAASEIAAARSSSRAAGTERPEPREAMETTGPGVTSGAADEGWKYEASDHLDSTSVMDCTTDVLDQETLDAVATHIVDASKMSITQQFASQDGTHEFLSCQYSGDSAYDEGMPFVQVLYQRNKSDERLDWCTETPATVADEYTFDPETGKGLLALLDPGMVGGAQGAPLIPQRTGWACSDDGTEMVSIEFGTMKGFGDANEGLTQVTASPVATSTTVVTEARDHLADTVLKDNTAFEDVIQMSSPYFLDAQMDEETLQAALEVPTGTVPEDLLTDQSTIERPEGAAEPVAPGQPPRPRQLDEDSSSSDSSDGSDSADSSDG